MQEHERIEYQRLRSEGRWNAASEFRESERKRLRAAGRNRQQAREESWEAMLEKFPPLAGQTSERPSGAGMSPSDGDDFEDSESQADEPNPNAEFADELKQLAQLTGEQPSDVDRDIEFAYRNMALATVTPLMSPSLAAWQWYLYSRREPNKFLEIFAKREDAKAKAAGAISAQQMEDDKRQQFAVIDRIIAQLEIDVKGIADELMTKFPEDLLNACRKHEGPWKAYFEKFPL